MAAMATCSTSVADDCDCAGVVGYSVMSGAPSDISVSALELDRGYIVDAPEFTEDVAAAASVDRGGSDDAASAAGSMDSVVVSGIQSRSKSSGRKVVSSPDGATVAGVVAAAAAAASLTGGTICGKMARVFTKRGTIFLLALKKRVHKSKTYTVSNSR